MSEPAPNIVKILLFGLERLRNGWCQGAHARDAKGKPGRFDGIGAHGKPVSYSAYGAIGGNDVLDMMRARDKLWTGLGPRQAGFSSLNDWNDAPGRTQAEVVDLYTETIAGMTA